MPCYDAPMRWACWLWIAAAAGCIGEPDLESRSASISGGTDDVADVAVVGIVDNGSGASCTGALVAPDLVITAQHCVAAPQNIGMCSQGTFGPARALAAESSGRLPTDLGVKDTVVVWPNETVWLAVDFALPEDTAFRGRQRYMFHCHNLEHEDGMMMRNFAVL